jgi:DNA-binding response OmpR family regulator
MATALPHVLIAEDNAMASDAMRVLFEATGHRVSVAGDVQDIVAIAGADPVDLMLLDAGLTGGDCFDVLAGIRAHASPPRVIAALTGSDDPELVKRCRDEGCVAVLLKPVPARELLRMAREWLSANDA